MLYVGKNSAVWWAMSFIDNTNKINVQNVYGRKSSWKRNVQKELVL